jgi:uncharacterized protein YcfJ
MTFTADTQKSIGSTLAGLALAGVMFAASAPAEAANGRNTAFVAGAVGGLAVGALLASQPRAYAAPVYVYEQPRCYTVHERVVHPYYGYTMGTRKVRLCD